MLAIRIRNAAQNLCRTPIYKYSVVAQAGDDCIEVTNDAGFRAILIGNPHNGAYAYIYAENEDEEGNWPSGYRCFPLQGEIVRLLTAVCAQKEEEDIRYHHPDTQSEDDLKQHLAACVAIIAKSIAKSIA